MGMLLLPESLEFALNPKVLWIVFAFTLCIVAILAAVLVYHWITYSYAPKQSSKAIMIFIAGLGLLVVGAIISLILFGTSGV